MTSSSHSERLVARPAALFAEQCVADNYVVLGTQRLKTNAQHQVHPEPEQIISLPQREEDTFDVHSCKPVGMSLQDVDKS